MKFPYDTNCRFAVPQSQENEQEERRNGGIPGRKRMRNAVFSPPFLRSSCSNRSEKKYRVHDVGCEVSTTLVCRFSTSPSRTGAALIIAVVILAALLMLGLPFLFTQSGSLSGTRSYAHERLASVGQDSAQNMGIAAAAQSFYYKYVPPNPPNVLPENLNRPIIKPLPRGNSVDDWTSLFEGLNGNDIQAGIRRLDINRIGLDTRQATFTFTGPGPAIVGVTIEDESGKLDPNYLDAVAWGQLLGQVGISDVPITNVPFNLGGQLASALSFLRYDITGGRITHLEQLQQAIPPSNVTPFRAGLTPAEFALLTPSLSIYNRGLGRGGQIDLGTIIDSSSSAGLTRSALDSVAPGDVVAYPPVRILAGSGSTVIGREINGDDSVFPASGWTARRPSTGMPVTLDSAPAVNLHQANAPVRGVLLNVAAALPGILNNPPSPSLISGLANFQPGSRPPDALGKATSWFDLTAPLNLFFDIGETTVGPSAAGDPGADGPYANGDTGQSIDAASLLPVLESRVRAFRVSGGNLDKFPTSGYARLQGQRSPDNAGVSEIIFYYSDLPVSVTDAQSNAIYTLRGIIRGLRSDGTAGGSAYTYLANGSLKLTALSPRDLPPLGIHSAGVVTIDSAATVTDPAGNQSAHEQHRVVAQALPQEAILEARYIKQAQLHTLIAQRHGSLLTSFPKPYPRITNILPDDPENNVVPPTTPITDPELMTGLRPAALRSLMTDANLKRDWHLSFSGNDSSALKVNDNREDPSAGGYSTADITPEGLRLDATRILAYPNITQRGLIRDETPADNTLTPINGRQFSLWIRPDADWDKKQIVLLDMQVPAGNAGQSFSVIDPVTYDPTAPTDPRVSGRADISNRFSLQYDGDNKHLVLVLNPGTIPHSIDYGPRIPKAFYGYTDTLPIFKEYYPAVNPESLGSGGIHPMASAAKQALIQHRYVVGDSFRKGHWHLVQVAFTSNQPGGMSIIVDQLVGRDVSRLTSDVTPTRMSLPGDHLTVPSLVLKTALGDSPPVKDTGAKALYVPRIELDAWAPVEINFVNGFVTGGAAVQALLPERGIIRIGNEYISYQQIDSDGALLNCVRARRQRSDATNGDNTVNWNSSHLLETHAIGDPVFAGGFAIGNIAANWYRGGCSLAQPMPDGDKDKGFQVWSLVSQEIGVGSPAITLATGVVDQFPPRGHILVGGFPYYYDNTAAVAPPGLLNVYYWGAMPNPLDPMGPAITGWVKGVQSTIAPGTRVVLISQEITGDPMRSNAYAGSGFVQLYDARLASNTATNGGRCEWLSYTRIRSDTDYPLTPNQRVSFLINDIGDGAPTDNTGAIGGFWFNPTFRTGARGRERTAFAANDLDDYTVAKYQFPIGTRVIPVQTNIDISYLLESGDVVTLAPTVLGVGQQPLQMCVRFAADDGFPETRNDASPITSWNVMNRYFAFTEAIPDTWNPNNKPFHLLSWPCWTPELDLSPLNTSDSWTKNRLGWVLPWANSYGLNFDSKSDYRQLFIGSLDNRAEPTATGMAATIDALHAGDQAGWQPNQLIQERIFTALGTPVTRTTRWLDDKPLVAPILIAADQTVFAFPRGLVEIGGEVFAYRRIGDNKTVDTIGLNNAELIGRSLLGSTRRIHTGNEIILHLPINPVAEINTALSANHQGHVQMSGDFFAPAMLLTSRNGDQHEITVMPDSHSAPWLRGLYNTKPVPWVERTGAAPANLAPIAIGWWPRYAPGLPQDTMDRSAEQRGALLRCRSFAWANFPMRFHQNYFTGLEVSSVNVIDSGDQLFDFKALALPGGFQWDEYVGSEVDITPTGATPRTTDVAGAFKTALFNKNAGTSPRFNGGGAIGAVDGADLRVIWTYRDTPLASNTQAATWLQDAALSGNRAPMLGPVIIRGRAPSVILNVER